MVQFGKSFDRVKTWTVHHVKMETLGENKQTSFVVKSRTGQARIHAINGKLIDLIPTKQFIWSHYENAEWLQLWLQILVSDGGWQRGNMVVLPEHHSAQPGLSVCQSTSTPWLGLVSIPLRRLSQLYMDHGLMYDRPGSEKGLLHRTWQQYYFVCPTFSSVFN